MSGRRLARLSFRSVGNTFHIGATLYTSRPIAAPENQGGTLLLTSEQDAISTLGVAYLGANFLGRDLQAGRRMVDPRRSRVRH